MGGLNNRKFNKSRFKGIAKRPKLASANGHIHLVGLCEHMDRQPSCRLTNLHHGSAVVEKPTRHKVP